MLPGRSHRVARIYHDFRRLARKMYPFLCFPRQDRGVLEMLDLRMTSGLSTELTVVGQHSWDILAMRHFILGRNINLWHTDQNHVPQMDLMDRANVA